MKRYFEYQHDVAIEETNVLGSVYFASHVRWQGHCRDAFLRQHAPDVLLQLTQSLAIVTIHCSCDYISEIAPFERVVLRMFRAGITQNRIALAFEYWAGEGAPRLVARGAQLVACMRRDTAGLSATEIPTSLARALDGYEQAQHQEGAHL